MFLKNILNFGDHSGVASTMDEISQVSNYWPSQSSFDRIEKEYCSLKNRWKIDLLPLTNVPIIGDLFFVVYFVGVCVWRWIFCPKRQTPSMGLQDTLLFFEGKIVSPHVKDITQEKCFQNWEILKIHNLTSSISLTQEDTSSDSPLLKTQPIKIQRNENGRFVLLQTGFRACTAAVTAMLILDAGKRCSISTLRTRNIADETSMCSDLKKAGLQPLSNRVTSVQQLRQFINKNGSAIVSVDAGIGGHVIIVDEIGRNFAKIRDPFHGWSITIPLISLSHRMSFANPIIQVQK